MAAVAGEAVQPLDTAGAAAVSVQADERVLQAAGVVQLMPPHPHPLLVSAVGWPQRSALGLSPGEHRQQRLYQWMLSVGRSQPLLSKGMPQTVQFRSSKLVPLSRAAPVRVQSLRPQAHAAERSYCGAA